MANMWVLMWFAPDTPYVFHMAKPYSSHMEAIWHAYGCVMWCPSADDMEATLHSHIHAV